ncbi:unnamed protein product, partial [Penicillium discolor]
MRVDLGGAQARVPQNLLHRAEIRTTVQQMGRRRVAEGVRPDGLRADDGCEGAGDDLVDRPRTDTSPATAEEDGGRRGAGPREQSRSSAAQLRHRVLRCHRRQRLRALRCHEPQAGVDGDDVLLARPPEERSRRGCASGQRRPGVATLGRLPEPFAQHLQVDPVDRAAPHARPEVSQIGAVRLHGRRREPTYLLEVVGERLDSDREVHIPSLPLPRLQSDAPRREPAYDVRAAPRRRVPGRRVPLGRRTPPAPAVPVAASEPVEVEQTEQGPRPLD